MSATASKEGTKKAPRRRDREDTKRRLLEAALEVFSRHGYDAATTRIIAKKAGANEALINRYFDGKAGLLIALVQSFVKEEVPPTNYPEGMSLEEELTNFFVARKCHIEERQAMMRVVLSRAIVDRKVADALGEHIQKSSIPDLRGRLQRLQSQGRISADTNLDGLTFALSTLGFGTCFLGKEVMRLPDALMETTIKEVVRLFSAALAPKK